MMAAAFLTVALVPNLEKHLWPFVIIYGISFFFTEFGPNATTFVYPSEIFPVRVRATGHGVAAAMANSAVSSESSRFIFNAMAWLVIG
jgi:hypothetical protein